MITDEELQRLNPSERATLLARLVDIDQLPRLTSATRRYRTYFLRIVTVSTIVLIPWIVIIAFTLPHRYRATHS